MIKFFRRIRQQLITQNRLGKYLLYAIGEIILVVIGILIALNINNWNEDQKSNAREQIYLQSLLGDMENILLEINTDIGDNEMVMQSCDTLLFLANKQTYQEVEDSNLERIIISLGNYAKLQLEEGTIEEIFSSGSLQTIKNDSIRGFLADWERNLVTIKEFEEFARNRQEKYLSYLNTFVPYYAFEYNAIKYPPNIRDIYFKHTLLLNTVAEIRFIARMLNQEYRKKINEIETFNALLRSELKE